MGNNVKLESCHNDIQKMLVAIGEDPKREGLRRTPQRYLETLSDLTSGYKADLKEIFRDAFFEEAYNDMIVVGNIEFYSLCEHHLLPFFGRCHVGYIPNKKIIGLSKIPRVIDVFAKRLQVQERMTHQIGEALVHALAPQGLGVIMEASHLCMMMRGVQKQNSFATTSYVNGCFLSLETREEFVSHVRSKPFS